MKNVRDYNVGKSDYANHKIQPWDIILEYRLNYWDGDIIKRVLRTKEGESRRLDYEKIIHICKERIRQIDAEDITYVEEDVDGTTVFCPSEEHKPCYHSNWFAFDVYAVFESGGQWYAYLGYNDSVAAHMYLSLTATQFVSVRIEGYPVPVILLSDRLAGVEHSASVKIGTLGHDRYGLYDYLISDNKLFRYMGLTEDQKFFKYVRFDGNLNVEFIETKSRMINYASQIICEN